MEKLLSIFGRAIQPLKKCKRMASLLSEWGGLVALNVRRSMNSAKTCSCDIISAQSTKEIQRNEQKGDVREPAGAIAGASGRTGTGAE